MATKEITTLNALKFICAVMVVWIHIPLFGLASQMIHINRIAVPIFFMISGYFLVNPDGTIPQKRIIKILKKIFVLTVIVNLIYYSYRAIVRHDYSLPLLRTILVGDTLNMALWYMNAYLEALILIWIIVKLNVTRILPWLAILGILINLILGSYYWVFWEHQPNLYLDNSLVRYAAHRNFFTIALPCIVTGTWIRLKERPLEVNKLVWIFGILLVGIYAEAIFRKIACGNSDSGDIGLLTIPLAIVIFLIALNLKSEHRIIRYMAHLGKNYSTNIFLFHLLIKGLFLLLVANLPFMVPDDIYWMWPVDIITVILLSRMYNFCMGRSHFNFKSHNIFKPNKFPSFQNTNDHDSMHLK